MRINMLFILPFITFSCLYSQSFVEQTGTPFTATWVGTSDWGDYDNDGNLDLLITGRTATASRIAKLYHNKGDGTFENTTVTLQGLDYAAVAWIDFNNDGFLDISLAGSTDGSYSTVNKLYKNNH